MANIEALPGRVSPAGIINHNNNIGVRGLENGFYGSIDLSGGRQMPEAPLLFVPPPEARACLLAESADLNTAGHEGRHVIAALNLNVPIESVVLAPDGNILGATFIGHTSWDNLKMIALAGTMHTLIGGEARGFGSDVMKARFINLLQGGDPYSSLFYEKLQAQAVVNQTPEKVQRKFFEILGFLGKHFRGTVPGSYIGQIMARARWEVEMESGGQAQEIYGFWASGEAGEIQNQERTVVTFGTDGFVRYHYEDREGRILGEKQLICPHCGEIMSEKAYSLIGHTCPEESPMSEVIEPGLPGGGLIYLGPPRSERLEPAAL